MARRPLASFDSRRRYLSLRNGAGFVILANRTADLQRDGQRVVNVWRGRPYPQLDGSSRCVACRPDLFLYRLLRLVAGVGCLESLAYQRLALDATTD